MAGVAVTGLGVVSPYGLGVDDMWNNLLAGVNGIRRIARLAVETLPGVEIAGEVPEFDVSPYVKHPKLLKAMTRAGGYLLVATHHALSAAGILEPAQREGLSTSVILGLGSHTPDRYELMPWDERPPLWYLETFPSLTLSQISINFELKDDFNALLNACASGTKAIADGAAQIRSGHADIAIVGAAESKLSRRHLEGFRRLGALSKNGDPESASRPFDRDRDGFVMGEGAGVLVLESYERALRRGAQIHALVSGSGSAMDANRLTDPDAQGRGLARAMLRALRDARLDSSQIDYINAHGTSTRANDQSESRAIHNVFGAAARNLPVSSSKSLMGHATAASGALEAIVCIKSLEQQRVHLTRNLRHPCENCAPLDYVAGASRDLQLEHVMSNSAGLGGLNSALILSAP